MELSRRRSIFGTNRSPAPAIVFLLLLRLLLVILSCLPGISGRALLDSDYLQIIEMVTANSRGSPDADRLETRFRSFAHRYDKTYSSPAEYAHRMEIFKENLREIEEASNGQVSYELEVNQFADITWEEFHQHFLGAQQNCSATQGNYVRQLGAEAIPAKKDWREKGIVSPVKNQGHCGSCWTFSSTGALEAAHAQATGKIVLFSEQQLLDCAGDFNNFACHGGLPSQAYEYIMYAGGLDTEEEYPYEAKKESCHFDAKNVAVKVLDVVNITQGAEDELLEAVALKQPVAIAFQVVKDFRFYKKGVYTSTVCKSGPDTVNHAVLAVGYGVDAAGTPYWIVKNSWGAKWGDSGYFLIERNKNMCGVATCASYPVVRK